MKYSGPERRVHTVFETRNREYHVRSGVCVAVRDLKTGVWISNHEAIGMELEVNLPSDRFVGNSLLFLSPFSKVQTSRVKDISRPQKPTVETYPILWAVCPS